jgi:hypothetical protein
VADRHAALGADLLEAIWFHIGTPGADGQFNITITIDKNLCISLFCNVMLTEGKHRIENTS